MPVLEGTDMDPTTASDTLVICTNLSNRPYRLLYSGRHYELPPGEPRNIPYLAMCLWFGNPKLRNLPGNDPNKKLRQQECDRLAAKWGVGFDAWYVDPQYTEPGVVPMTSNDWDEVKLGSHEYALATIAGRQKYKNPRLPSIKCETFDGKRIITVIDDPTGELSFGDDGSARERRSEAEWLRHQLEVTRQQTSALLDGLRKVNPDAAAEVEEKMAVPLTGGDMLPTFDTTEHPSLVDAADPVAKKGAPTDLVKAAMANISTDGLGSDGMADTIESDPKPTRGAKRPS